VKAIRRDAWCPEDLSLEVMSPRIFFDRSAANTAAAIEQFDGQARYVKRDVDGHPGDETFCNFFVRETLAAQGVFIPRMRANDMVDWFARSTEWATVPAWIARDLAERGRPVVVGWKNDPGRPGHVARLRAARPGDDSVSWYIAQAGLTNFIYAPLSSGFGARPVKFFACP